ncbi:MAG: U32 family peptidase C-terminal domain-containing protein, partial [Schwartzia sp.]|nr:U32 family peptidase C-terminal domain-containing protein [Schwartzia sp. (in: firmicutes)]
EIEVFQPRAKGFRQSLSDMLDEEGNPISDAPHPQQIIYIKMEQPVEPYTILRRDVKS